MKPIQYLILSQVFLQVTLKILCKLDYIVILHILKKFKT